MLASATISIALISVGSFAIIWIAACKIISLFGWNDLAKRNRARRSAEGTRYPGQSIILGRFGRYRGCITFHTSPAGIHMAVFPIFRICHPPLFFPWSAIRLVKHQKTFLGQQFLYELGTPRVCRVTLHGDIHRAVQEHQNGD